MHYKRTNLIKLGNEDDVYCYQDFLPHSVVKNVYRKINCLENLSNWEFMSHQVVPPKKITNFTPFGLFLHFSSRFVCTMTLITRWGSTWGQCVGSLLRPFPHPVDGQGLLSSMEWYWDSIYNHLLPFISIYNLQLFGNSFFDSCTALEDTMRETKPWMLWRGSAPTQTGEFRF